jgi:hypothetical protein
MLRVVLAPLLVAAVAASGCPNKCSGHGSCVLGDKCECQPLFVGHDCSQRECAYGLSWITAKDTLAAPAGTLEGHEGLGGRHLYAECSDKGKCDRSTGECQCYEGYEGKGCRRQKCPSDCSGHGRCVYNQILNAHYSPQGYEANNPGADIAPSHFIEFGSQYWDRMKTRSCVCDRGFEGTDCADRTCPKGDDPLTDCGTDGQEHSNDVQYLAFSSGHFTTREGGTATAIKQGFFTLTFMDMFGANYTTRPIELPDSDFDMDSTDDSVKDATRVTVQRYADDIEEALESLANFAIPNVTVSLDEHIVTGVGFFAFKIEFVDEHNAGAQSMLQCSALAATINPEDEDVPSPYNYGASQPRFVSPFAEVAATITTATFVVDCDGVNTGHDLCTDNTADKTLPFSESSYYAVCQAFANRPATMKEAAQCSNRGVCDHTTGQCGCDEGFTGEACSTQTVFF